MCEYFHKDLDGDYVLDEQGNKIPSNVCICYAREPNECCCGAWDDVDIDWWYDEPDF